MLYVTSWVDIVHTQLAHSDDRDAGRGHATRVLRGGNRAKRGSRDSLRQLFTLRLVSKHQGGRANSAEMTDGSQKAIME